MKQERSNTLFLVEVAVFSALAFLFDFIAGLLSLKIWPQGGSISIAMVPVFIMAFRWGIKGGILSGTLLGLLQVISGFSQIFSPIQGFIDYGIAFSAIGMAGLFTSQVKNSLTDNNKRKWMTFAVLGVFIGSVLRYFCHVVAGIVFYAEYAPAGQPVAIYSLIYNGTYMLPSFIVSAIIVILVIGAAPKKMIHAK